MVKVSLEIAPMLRGGGKYRISTHRETTKNSYEVQTEGNILQAYEQHCGLGFLRSRMEAFGSLDCNVHLIVHIGKGEAIIEGTIKAITREAFQVAKLAADQLADFVKAFPYTYAGASGTLMYGQTVELKSAKRTG